MLDRNLTDQIISLLEPYELSRIGVFGSFARGEETKKSDLDLLISFNSQIGLLKLVQIQQELEDKLGITVDLVTEKSLKNPRLKKYIYQDLIMIYHDKGQSSISRSHP